MHQRIIYQNPNNTVSFLIPVLDSGLTIQQIAEKDVPAGRPWRIVSATELPQLSSRNRWEWTESGPLNIAENVAEN